MRRNASVLVIDDEEIMRDILGTLLEREGYSVRLASSGQEGLDLAKSLPFDAVIVDVMMPGLDGLQVLDQLKKHDEELPVLMITAYASMESAILAMKKGAMARVDVTALGQGGGTLRWLVAPELLPD